MLPFVSARESRASDRDHTPSLCELLAIQRWVNSEIARIAAGASLQHQNGDDGRNEHAFAHGSRGRVARERHYIPRRRHVVESRQDVADSGEVTIDAARLAM